MKKINLVIGNAINLSEIIKKELSERIKNPNFISYGS